MFKKINRETDSIVVINNIIFYKLIVNQRHLQVHLLYGLKNKSICTLYYHTVPWAKNKKIEKGQLKAIRSYQNIYKMRQKLENCMIGSEVTLTIQMK